VYELPAFGRLSAASAASPSGKVPPSPETAAAYPADSAASADAAPVAARTPKTKRFSCGKNLFYCPPLPPAKQKNSCQPAEKRV